MTATRDQSTLEAGIRGLEILKTGNSAFSGFMQDDWTTLQPTEDRLFGTALNATWRYGKEVADYNDSYERIHSLLLEAFAAHKSDSVQHTLYAMAESALNKAPEISEVHLVMPNKHRLLIDLSRLGLDNPNEIFVPTDEPSGYIEARITR
jgi:urate oxidase